MPDIFHDFPITAPAQQVFRAIATPTGLDAWWTRLSSGAPAEGSEYDLNFGSGYDWRAVVTRCQPDEEFELKFTSADKDWLGSRVGFALNQINEVTHVNFHHVDWPEQNDHYRISCYCWAMYLRLLRRYVEHGERVSYEDRLDV